MLLLSFLLSERRTQPLYTFFRFVKTIDRKRKRKRTLLNLFHGRQNTVNWRLDLFSDCQFSITVTQWAQIYWCFILLFIISYAVNDGGIACSCHLHLSSSCPLAHKASACSCNCCIVKTRNEIWLVTNSDRKCVLSARMYTCCRLLSQDRQCRLMLQESTITTKPSQFFCLHLAFWHLCWSYSSAVNSVYATRCPLIIRRCWL